MSEHSVNIIEIGDVLPHENADRLEIVPVGGWQAVVKKGDFIPGQPAVYVEPDYMIPTDRAEFSFLAQVGRGAEIEGRHYHRLKAVRLRGVISFGLLIHVPAEVAGEGVGADVMERLDIRRYEPTVRLAGADELPEDQWPKVYASVFDVESLQRHKNALDSGEPIIVTEKIHGANARYVWWDGALYIGSRTRWLKPDVDHPWGRAAKTEPRIAAWCEAHPGVVLYGEIYGAVQSLKYGLAPGQISFVAFAASENGVWWDTMRLLDDPSIPTVPVLAVGNWNPDWIANDIAKLAEADSAIPTAPAGHIREGVVIVPVNERRDPRLGRVALKHVSNRYWTGDA